MVQSPLRTTKSSSGKKSPAKKLRAQRSPNILIKWTDKLVNSLLTLVLEIAPYRESDNKKVSAKWEEVATRFVNLPESSEIKDAFLSLGEVDAKDAAVRRIKEKYWKVTKDVEKILGVGNGNRPLNNSGVISSPDLTEMKRLCEAIEKDKSEENADSSSKLSKSKNNKLNDVEQDVWKISKNRRAPLKTKNIDGSIVDLTMSSKSSSKKSFDEQLLDIMFQEKKERGSLENEIFEKMTLFIEQKNLNEISLFKDANCNMEDAEVKRDFKRLQNLGLDTLVTVYCNPGNKFSMRFFMKTLKELKFSLATVLKLYNALKLWQRDAKLFTLQMASNDTEDDNPNLSEQGVGSPALENEEDQEEVNSNLEQALEGESIEIDDDHVLKRSDITNAFFVEIWLCNNLKIIFCNCSWCSIRVISKKLLNTHHSKRM